MKDKLNNTIRKAQHISRKMQETAFVTVTVGNNFSHYGFRFGGGHKAGDTIQNEDGTICHVIKVIEA